MIPQNPILLGVNIDHVATVRQARYRGYESTCGGMIEPDVLYLALQAEQGGADGITVHLREDRRHIQEEDVYRLRKAIQTRFNLEMACTDDMVEFAKKIKPDTVCLVPEKRQELTTEGGLDVVAGERAIGKVIEQLHGAGIPVSLFIDPDDMQIRKASVLGAEMVELHTGSYAHGFHNPEKEKTEYGKLFSACEFAHGRGLVVNAGHGINYQNVKKLRKLPHLCEMNIGHTLVAKALSVGMQAAVSEMRSLMNSGLR